MVDDRIGILFHPLNIPTLVMRRTLVGFLAGSRLQAVPIPTQAGTVTASPPNPPPPPRPLPTPHSPLATTRSPLPTLAFPRDPRCAGRCLTMSILAVRRRR